MSVEQLRNGKEMAGVSTLIKRLVVMSGLPIICYLRRVSERDKPTLSLPHFFVVVFVYTKVCARAEAFSTPTSILDVLFGKTGLGWI